VTIPVRQAVVLAGGRGSRLGPLTDDTPKPLLHVAERPFLDWVIDNLARHGVTDVILTIGYRAESFEPWLQGRSAAPRVTTFIEQDPLDTGGALTLLADQLDETFLVLNGDTLFDAPLGQLAARLADGPSAIAVALRSVTDSERYGRVTLDGSLVTSFDEKGESGPGLINGGVYAVRRDVLSGRVAPLSLERELLPDLVVDGRVAGVPSGGFFIDIGVPESFEEAQRTVPRWWEEVGSSSE